VLIEKLPGDTAVGAPPGRINDQLHIAIV
jgi:hypothetical protein